MPYRIKKISLISCFLFAFIFLNAQRHNYADSLKKIISKDKTDSNYIKRLKLLSGYYVMNNPDSAIKYASLIINEKKIVFASNYKKIAYNQVAYSNYNKGNYSEAIKIYKNAASYSKLLNDTNNYAISIMNEGNVYIETLDYKKALEQYKKTIEITENTNYQYTNVQAHSNIGFVYKELGDYANAEIYFYTALKKFELLDRKKSVADMLNNLTVTSLRKKEYIKAFQFNREALTILKNLSDSNRLAISYQLLGDIYSEKEDYANAIKSVQQALNIFVHYKDKRQIATSYSTVATLYFKKKEYNKSITYYDSSIILNKQIGNKRTLGSIYTFLANSNIKNGQYINAKKELDSADVYINQSNSLNDKKNYFETLSDYYLAVNNSTESIKMYKIAVSLQDSILNQTNLKLMNNLNIQYETEKKELTINLLSKSDSIKGLKILGQELAIRNNLLKIADQNLALTEADLQLTEDSLTIKTNNEIILKNKLDAQQKEEKISLLAKQKRIQELEVNKKNNTIIALGIGILLIAFAGFAFYKQRTAQQQAKLQLAVAKEQDIAMQGIIEAEEKERQRIAVELHDGVGQVMTAAWLNLNALKNEIAFETTTQANIFNTSLELVDDGCKEVRSVSHNMMPNALVKKGLINAVREFIQQINTNKLSINLQTNGLNKPLPNHIETVLYRVIQESVNNVIKHANASNLDISINQEIDGVDVMIEDNGVGFNPKITRATDGIGLMNIKNRVQYLKGTVEWNAEPNKGTAVAIYIPVENANS